MYPILKIICYDIFSEIQNSCLSKQIILYLIESHAVPMLSD